MSILPVNSASNCCKFKHTRFISNLKWITTYMYDTCAKIGKLIHVLHFLNIYYNIIRGKQGIHFGTAIDKRKVCS